MSFSKKLFFLLPFASYSTGLEVIHSRLNNELCLIGITRMYNTSSAELQSKMSCRCSLSTRLEKRMASLTLFLLSLWIQTPWTSCLWGLLENISLSIKEVFICTAVQIILRLFAQQASSVLCRASFTLSHRLPLFVYTLPFTVLLLAAAHAMYTVEDEGETNTNSLELNDEFEVI